MTTVSFWLDEPAGPSCSRREWSAGFAHRAAAAGVEIHEHTRVRSLAEAGADIVVVATDGYPSGLLGELEGLIVPGGSQTRKAHRAGAGFVSPP